MKQLNIFNSKDSTYEKIFLDESHYIEFYSQVGEFVLNKDDFEKLWNEHPEEFHEVIMLGKKVKTPRWQQSYGKNYEYTGSRNNALPITKIHEKYLEWCRAKVDSKLNGLLINWYDGRANHYIGKHRDSTKGLIKNTPIVTISHGEERVFRFRPFGGKGYRDFLVSSGDVLVIPWETNTRYTHEVPNFNKYNQRRISVTLRAYT